MKGDKIIINIYLYLPSMTCGVTDQRMCPPNDSEGMNAFSLLKESDMR